MLKSLLPWYVLHYSSSKFSSTVVNIFRKHHCMFFILVQFRLSELIMFLQPWWTNSAKKSSSKSFTLRTLTFIIVFNHKWIYVKRRRKPSLAQISFHAKQLAYQLQLSGANSVQPKHGFHTGVENGPSPLHINGFLRKFGKLAKWTYEICFKAPLRHWPLVYGLKTQVE